MPALPLLLSLHILPWHILFLAQSKCALRGRISLTSASAAKAQRCSQVQLATTYACNAAAALSSHPFSAVLTPVSILRTTKTVFPPHAPVETYFKSSQAYEAHECALSWETSPRAWLANVRAIEMEKGLIPVPASSGFLLVCVVPA